MEDFKFKVFKIIRKIPKGRVTSYKEVARALGRPGAARAVGNALNKNEKLLEIPCHRVIKSNGEAGDFKIGRKNKVKYLREDGVIIVGGKIINFDKRFYKLM